MARPLRVWVPDGWYHVVNRGNHGGRIFRTDDDRRRFLGCLSELPERFAVAVHAFVLMDNHYHLLLRPRNPDLSRAIQWLQLSYAVRFNWAHQVPGHLFQGRFKAAILQHEHAVPEVARYLHLNPVRVAALGMGKRDRQRSRAGAVKDPGQDLVARRMATLAEYPWSSWQVYSGRDVAPSWLETAFLMGAHGGRSLRERVGAIRAYTEEPLRQGHLENPWDRLVGGWVLGDADYAKQILKQAKADVGQQTEARRLARPGRMEWEKLVGWAEKETGVTWPEALGRHGDWTRDAVVYVAVRHGGWRLSEVVGRIAGLKYPAAAQGVKRIEARRTRDAACDRFLRRLRDQISTV
ncbi:MAG: transposase [Verrucomicrobiota bacterium]|jgi:REP element-mobilizing transposase RayT